MLRAIGILALAAGALALVGWESSAIPTYGEICSEAQKSAEKHCTTNHIALVVLWHIGEALNYYGAAIAAVATAGVLIFTGTLWRATERLWTSAERQIGNLQEQLMIAADAAETAQKTVAHMESAAERELRAYIGVRLLQRDDGANPTFDRVSGPWIALEIRNFGKTPAYKVTHWLTTAMGPPDWPGPFEDGSKQVSGFPTTVQSDAGLQTASRGPKPLLGHPEAWAQGELVAYAWGEVHYLDAFQKPRCTKFRLTYGAADLQGGTIGVRLCREGNDAD